MEDRKDCVFGVYPGRKTNEAVNILRLKKAILEHAEIPINKYLVLIDLGIEKNKDFDLKKEDIDRIKDECKGMIKKADLAEPSRPVEGCGCQCC